MTLADDESVATTSENVVQSLGTIRLAISEVILGQKTKTRFEPATVNGCSNTLQFDEQSKKARLSQSTGYATRPPSRRARTLTDPGQCGPLCERSRARKGVSLSLPGRLVRASSSPRLRIQVPQPWWVVFKAGHSSEAHWLLEQSSSRVRASSPRPSSLPSPLLPFAAPDRHFSASRVLLQRTSLTRTRSLVLLGLMLPPPTPLMSSRSATRSPSAGGTRLSSTSPTS